MSIREQVKHLLEIADRTQNEAFFCEWYKDYAKDLRQAADTIESLSAKLQAADMERSNNGEAVKLIEAMAEELDNCYGRTTELTDRAYEYINRSSEDCGGWIPCKGRLPKEKGWYLVYAKNQRPFVAYFKGKTFPLNNHYHEIVAWQPLPEPYEP